MTKIKITESQYKKILLHESTNRLIKNKTITESTEILEEGVLDKVLLTLALLTGSLSGNNEIQAQNNLKKDNAKQIITQVKQTLSDEASSKELIKLMGEKGVRNPSKFFNKLEKNADEVINDLKQNSPEDVVITTKDVSDIKKLALELSQGGALKSWSVDVEKGGDIQEIVVQTDTLDISFNAGTFFKSGGIEISKDGYDSIKVAIDEIKKQNGQISSIEIESSTDTERFPSFISPADPTGNIKLANERSKSVINYIKSLGIDSNIIKHIEKPNNNEFSEKAVTTKDFINNSNDKNTTDNLRNLTKGNRYARVKIVAVFPTSETTTKPGPDKLVYNFEIIKTAVKQSHPNIIISVTDYDHKNVKCKLPKGSNKIADCFKF
jgi:hypothetical protein